MNAIGTQLRDPINPGLARWRLTVWWLDAVAQSVSKEKNPRVTTARFSLWVWGVGRLTRDGTVEPVSRYQTHSQARTGTGKKYDLSVQLTTSRISNHVISALSILC